MTTDDNQAPEAHVKERCWDQREALPREPLCAICGHYGEYTCDETDDDIYSLECKRFLLSRVAKLKASYTQPPSIRLPARDECYYVQDGNNNQNLNI